MASDKKIVLQFVMNTALTRGLPGAVREASREFGMKEAAVWAAIRKGTEEVTR
jgi:hypothetical protein